MAFFVIWNKKLMPIAIVLDKRKPAEKVNFYDQTIILFDYFMKINTYF